MNPNPGLTTLEMAAALAAALGGPGASQRAWVPLAIPLGIPRQPASDPLSLDALNGAEPDIEEIV